MVTKRVGPKKNISTRVLSGIYLTFHLENEHHFGTVEIMSLGNARVLILRKVIVI